MVIIPNNMFDDSSDCTCIWIISTVFAAKSDTEQVKNTTKGQASQNVSQEIISKRTENSRTFLNADGTFKAEISQKPIH